MAAPPTGTVTFLITDIEGSTELLQRLGDHRYEEILAEHRRLLREAFAEGHGQEIDADGDAFLVGFSQARDAVGAAITAQRALTKHAWPNGTPIRVRMVLDTRKPVSETGSHVGLDVHRGARICSAGQGGQILVSQAVEVLAGPDLPPGASLRDLGTHRLRDLKEPEHVFQVMHPDLATNFPPLKSLDANVKTTVVSTRPLGRTASLLAVTLGVIAATAVGIWRVGLAPTGKMTQPTTAVQQAGKPARLGFISTSTTNVSSPFLAALRQGLRDLGYEEQKNLTIEYRFAESKEQLPAMAENLVRLRVDVILGGGSEGITAAKNATRSIPIVMTNSGDAVREGFVASLAHPGGNITGLTQISPELAGKRLQILKDLVPTLSRVAVLWYPLHPNTPFTFRETRAAAEKLGLRVLSLEVKEPKDFEEAFTSLATERIAALVVLRDPFTVRHRALIAKSAIKLRVPAIYETGDYVQAGGLMFYGPDFAELYRRAATYVDKILKGAKPADLPVEQPTRFKLVINLKTAQAIGLAIPQSLLSRADEVIQ